MYYHVGLLHTQGNYVCWKSYNFLIFPVLLNLVRVRRLDESEFFDEIKCRALPDERNLIVATFVLVYLPALDDEGLEVRDLFFNLP